MLTDNQLDLTFEWRGLRLAGTLRLPNASPPYPAVLMLQGSGPADRDSDGYFPPIRDAFLSRSIATFSFDKPGCGASTGDWRHHNLGDRADQALAAIGLLRENKLIDNDRIGVWGQSQGGWLVQILAVERPDLAFVIANSGPAISLDAQNLAGCEHTMQAAGATDAEITAALDFITEATRRARNGEAYNVVNRELFESARKQPWYGYMAIDDEIDWQLACHFVQEQYEPVRTIEQINCPILAIFGERDVLVPAWESAMLYGKALRAADNQDATIVVFPQGNHRILVEETGEFCTGYLDLLAGWAAGRMFPGDS